MSTVLPGRGFRAPFDIAATTTSLVVLDVRETKLVAVTLKNPDGLQSLSVTFNTRAHPLDDLAPRSVFEEMTAIPPGQSRTVDVSVGGAVDLEVLAIASGVGVTQATLSVMPGDRRP